MLKATTIFVTKCFLVLCLVFIFKNLKAAEADNDAYLLHTFQTALLSYELAKEQCTREWKNSAKITIPIETLKQLNFLNKRQLFYTINYYLDLNQKKCLGADTLNLIFSANLLKNRFSNSRNGMVKKLEFTAVNNALPSLTTIESQVFFESLSLNDQNTLNKIFLDKLYDVDRINNLDEIKNFYFK